MKMNVTSLHGVWSRGLRGVAVSIVALVVATPGALSRPDAPADAGLVRMEAPVVPHGRAAEARIVHVVPLEKAMDTHAIGPTERGGPSGLLHSNITTYLNQNFINGGASGTGSAAITKLIAGQLFLQAPGTVNQMKFAVVNTLDTPVTARCLARFYQTNGGGGGPGTFIVGYNFNALTFAANTLTIVVGGVSAAALPANVWAGMTFDAGGNGPALATLAQLNALGMGLFSPADVGDINGQMFRTTNAGSFVSNNPAGSQSSNAGTSGWELRTTEGGCCLGTGPCQVLEEIACLNLGGNYRGDGSDCNGCSLPPTFFNAVPPAGFYYGLDQISLCDISSNLLQKRSSQQVAVQPPSNLNIAVIDEFTLTQKRVIARVDSLVGVSGVGTSLPPPNGFLLSVWGSPSAASTDLTLESNTLYDQGYTLPLLFRGGGEYDLVSIGGGNPLSLKGVAVHVNPTIALRPDVVGPREPDERGITPVDDHGLVLAAGTYYISIIHRGNAAWGTGQIADSNHQDPRFPSDNAFQVNPGGGVFPGLSRNINVPASFRVLMRNCKADFNGDGSINTNDLVAFLGAFGTGGTGYTPYDLNGDESVNTSDLVDFLGLFGMPCR